MVVAVLAGKVLVNVHQVVSGPGSDPPPSPQPTFTKTSRTSPELWTGPRKVAPNDASRQGKPTSLDLVTQPTRQQQQQQQQPHHQHQHQHQQLDLKEQNKTNKKRKEYLENSEPCSLRAGIEYPGTAAAAALSINNTAEKQQQPQPRSRAAQQHRTGRRGSDRIRSDQIRSDPRRSDPRDPLSRALL